MRILVTNDDGIHSQALWALVKELKNFSRVTVVATDREQSAIGTAVTLRHILRAKQIEPVVPDVETYSIEGTPSDSVFLALGKLVKGKIDMVVSGINQGLNLGEDTHISGTVAAALQGYLHGLPSFAISADCKNGQNMSTAARADAILAKKIAAYTPRPKIFLNVNLPDLPLSKIGGVRITRLDSGSHIDSVDEGHDGRQKYYWLVRQKAAKAAEAETDVWAIEHGDISITPLQYHQDDKLPENFLNSLCSELLQELKK